MWVQKATEQQENKGGVAILTRDAAEWDVEQIRIIDGSSAPGYDIKDFVTQPRSIFFM